MSHDQEGAVDPAGVPLALIREARRRARRRRIRRGLSVLGLAGLTALALLLGDSGSGRGSGRGSGVIAQTGSRPFANVRAFAHQGQLAFVSRGRLWVLDGSGGALRELPSPAGYIASSPSFSPDRRWLAYVVSHPGSPGLGLWLARANGTGAHVVRGLAVDRPIGWSPVADLFAVLVPRKPAHPFFGWSTMPTAVDLVSPNGRALRLFAAADRRDSIEAAVWSPHGQAIAISTYAPDRTGGTVVRAVPLADPPHPTTWFSIRNLQQLALPGVCRGECSDQVIAQLVGWSSEWGMTFWIYSGGMTHNNDATPFAVLARPGARPRVIAHTLSDGLTDAIATGPQGALAVVDSSTGWRELAQGKVVETCEHATGACTPLPQASMWRHCPCAPDARPGRPGAAVTLDPAWSPTGAQLAYVKAPVDLARAWPGLGWYGDHQLYLWSRRTATTRRLAAVEGAQLPTWSHDSRALLYAANDGLWLVRVDRGQPMEIVHPLFSERQWNAVAANAEIAYYGQIPWNAQFSWNSP